MTRLLGVVVLASALSLAAAPKPGTASPTSTYTFRILSNPTTGDEFGFRNAIQQTAQTDSDKLFNALVSVLGGGAPQLNFVPMGSALTPGDLSANFEAAPGAPQGTINVDPLAIEALTNNGSAYHSSSVNALPHEMSHLRQTPAVLASLADREGGAQAFTDLVTPEAAHRAGIPYANGNYDGSYSNFVKAAQAKGRDYLLAGQFGRAVTPAWP